MDSSSEKAHQIAAVFMQCKTIDEVDRLTAEFNHMLPVLRSHVKRIEKINNDGGIIGKEHPDGYIIISMEDNK